MCHIIVFPSASWKAQVLAAPSQPPLPSACSLPTPSLPPGPPCIPQATLVLSGASLQGAAPPVPPGQNGAGPRASPLLRAGAPSNIDLGL
jgi:hypothetical protein